jgi:N-acetylmuramoyl-L-alanine amidase
LVEKNVTLAVARRLQKELEARGIAVVLTRVADNVLTSEQRALSANTSHAMLYVALHASGSGHGLRFYTALLPRQDAGEGQRRFVRWDAAQSAYLLQSQTASAAISAECASGGLPVRNSSAALRPLNSVMTAAVAVELAPLGGSPDELGDAQYQQKLAVSLASGISRLRGQWAAGR